MLCAFDRKRHIMLLGHVLKYLRFRNIGMLPYGQHFIRVLFASGGCLSTLPMQKESLPKC